jgi:hypothetical protein
MPAGPAGHGWRDAAEAAGWRGARPHATRRLGERFDAWQAGRISFAEFDASVQGWINHVRYADTWGLREHVLDRFVWGPGDCERKSAAVAVKKTGRRPRSARSQSH